MSPAAAPSFPGMGYWEMKAALEWQIAMGADEAILDAPVDRTTAPDPAPSAPAPAVEAAPEPQVNAVAVAEAAARGAGSLDALRDAMEAYDLCELKRGARQLVFADGQPNARVMIVGEAPGRDEDEQGLPFVGKSGQLLDRMLKAGGFDRHSDDPATSVFITNAVFWRPPGNRNPSTAELLMCLPFVRRAIELAAPRVVMTAGNIPTQALLETTQGITRVRGNWRKLMVAGRELDVMPSLHPSYLLRSPEARLRTHGAASPCGWFSARPEMTGRLSRHTR